MIKKYRLLCKKDYIEGEFLMDGDQETRLFKGEVYDIEEELWINSGPSGATIVRRAILNDTYVAFLSVPFYDYFYTEAEARDMKLKELGI